MSLNATCAPWLLDSRSDDHVAGVKGCVPVNTRERPGHHVEYTRIANNIWHQMDVADGPNRSAQIGIRPSEVQGTGSWDQP